MSVFYPLTALVPMESYLKAIEDFANQATITVRVVFFFLSLVFLLIGAVKGRFTMPAIIMAILCAGVALWGVWNIDKVKDNVGDTINGQGNGQGIITQPFANRHPDLGAGVIPK